MVQVTMERATAQIASLIAEAQLGDERALHDLLVLVRPDIRRFAMRSCYVTADVEDAVQESLWILARRMHGLREVASFTSWMMTVVARECRRLAQRVSAVISRSAEPIDQVADHQRFAVMPLDDLRLDVAAAIASLPPQYRDIVVARDLRELTIDEISAELGLTREATKGRLRRGRVLLREYLVER